MKKVISMSAVLLLAVSTGVMASANFTPATDSEVAVSINADQNYSLQGSDADAFAAAVVAGDLSSHAIQKGISAFTIDPSKLKTGLYNDVELVDAKHNVCQIMLDVVNVQGFGNTIQAIQVKGLEGDVCNVMKVGSAYSISLT